MCTDKAAGLLFSVKGDQHRAVELKHNSVRVCVYCVCLCAFGLFTCCNTTLIPERTPGAPCPYQRGQAVLTPHRPPFEFFSVLGRCSRVTWNVFVSVRCSFGVGITHPVFHQIECAAFVFLILAAWSLFFVNTFYFKNNRDDQNCIFFLLKPCYWFFFKSPCFCDLFELVPMRFCYLRVFLITPGSYGKEFRNNSCLPANNLSLWNFWYGNLMLRIVLNRQF